MFSLIGMKAKLAAAGSILLAVAYFFVRFNYLKNKNERLARTAETLKARSVQEQVFKKLKRKEEEKLVSHRAELIKEMNKPKEEFQGAKNLSDANDF